MGRHRWAVGAVALLVFSGCDDAPVGERDELAEAVAERAHESEMQQLEELAAQQDARSGDELHDELGSVMADLTPPPGVAELRIPSEDRTTDVGEGLVQIARPMVVVPEDGDPFCVVIGLGSDGTAAGARAEGDTEEGCRDAMIPRQDESAVEGNPLDLWDQTDRVL